MELHVFYFAGESKARFAGVGHGSYDINANADCIDSETSRNGAVDTALEGRYLKVDKLANATKPCVFMVNAELGLG